MKFCINYETWYGKRDKCNITADTKPLARLMFIIKNKGCTIISVKENI
jgi:hypothetical protein